MPDSTSEAPKREEQVVVLAAGGLTDKEIAGRLGISPDTVGTYWRRVLARFHAASRTECVAKYLEIRNRQTLENLEFVNECLHLVNEHLLTHGPGRSPSAIADAILASIQQWIVVVDSEGNLVFSNKPTKSGARFIDLVRGDDVQESLQLAAKGPVYGRVENEDGDTFDFIFTAGAGAVEGMVVGCGRPL
jgi:DNA-binding CsgD family transcriptional regulator